MRLGPLLASLLFRFFPLGSGSERRGTGEDWMIDVARGAVRKEKIEEPVEAGRSRACGITTQSNPHLLPDDIPPLPRSAGAELG